MSTETDETNLDTEVPDEQPDAVEETSQQGEDEPETFPRDYVERLRKENAEARVKAKKAEQYAHELHAARVAATGRLADPTDLPFDERHLDDLAALEAAIDELLARKPHLGSRRPRGDVGQGVGGSTASTDLAGILRSRA